MTQLRPDGFEWSLQKQIEMIAEDGVDLVYGDFDIDEIQPLLNNFDLGSTITAFPDSIEALKPST